MVDQVELDEWYKGFIDTMSSRADVHYKAVSPQVADSSEGLDVARRKNVVGNMWTPAQLALEEEIINKKQLENIRVRLNVELTRLGLRPIEEETGSTRLEIEQ